MKARLQRRYRRLFAWVAAGSTTLALGLLSVEVIFPTVPAAPYASASGAGFQRWLLVVAVVLALVSFAGAIVTTLLALVAKWKERVEDATSASGRFGLAAEPANERLRALRAVISPSEETPVRES